MKLFDRFKKPSAGPVAAVPGTSASPSTEGCAADALVEIARIVTGGNEAVLQETALCATDIQGFYTAQEDFFMETCMERSRPPLELQWRGLTKILEDHGYVCERDWKDCKEDFVFFVQNLKGTKANSLPVEPDWFDENDDVFQWGTILTEKWAASGFAAAVFDINSDSYVVFPCRRSDFAQLQELAAQLNARFSLLE